MLWGNDTESSVRQLYVVYHKVEQTSFSLIKFRWSLTNDIPDAKLQR